jgi:two-component sensor histidine kinase
MLLRELQHRVKNNCRSSYRLSVCKKGKP